MTVPTRIRELLRRYVGFAPDTLGEGVYESAIEARRKALGLDAEAWFARVERDPAELDALVEALVVPETWFFRDETPFVETVRHAMKRMPDASRPYRVLSMPCATGEEAYSVAIALREGGLSPAQFRIEGIDVSTAALARASQATYRAASFRSPRAESSKSLWFTPVGDSFALMPMVRESVHFRRGNAIDPATLASSPPFDCIFCRNLLIYFDRPAREALIARLTAKLTDGGLLFVGHAESLVGFDRGLRRLADVRAFGYERIPDEDALRAPGDSSRSAAAHRVSRTPLERPRTVPPGTLARGSRPPSETTLLLANAKTSPRAESRPALESVQSTPRIAIAAIPGAKTVTQVEPVRDPLDAARALADRGALAEARVLVIEALKNPSAEGYHLLGVIARGEGNLDEAERCFSRALYLDSVHYSSLVQMALLRERRGDPSAAQFRARAGKLRRSDGDS